jgi:hypothetical protein
MGDPIESAYFLRQPDPVSEEGGVVKLIKHDGTQIVLKVGMCIEVATHNSKPPTIMAIESFTKSNGQCTNIDVYQYIKTTTGKNMWDARKLPRAKFGNITETTCPRDAYMQGQAEPYIFEIHDTGRSLDGGRRKNRRKTKKTRRSSRKTKKSSR